MKKSGTFTYLGSDDVTRRHYEYTYDDAWFDEPSDKQNFDLLKFALCLSYAASLREDITEFYDQIGYEYTDKIDYESEGLNVLAGDKVTDSVYYPAPAVDGKYYLNSIGYAIGYKEYNGSNIIVVSIRGGHYGSEWGGNFNIGTGVNHEGFLMAANQVLDGLKTEVEKLGKDKPVKVLITGYSRAAAAANLLGALLDDGAIDGLQKDNIYTFCFECPRGTTSPEAFSEKYNNITCVSNPNDIVPKVAESVFGYKRYGKTYYIPSPETSYNFNETYLKVMETEKRVIPFMFVPAIDATLVEFNFVDDLAFVVKSQDYYVKHFQEAFMDASAAFLGGAKIDITPQQMGILDVVQKLIMNLNPVNTLEIIKGFGSTPENAFAISFASPILQNHAMELTISWLETLGGFDQFGPDEFQLIYLNNASEVILYDEDKELAKYVDGRIENNTHLYIDINNSGLLVLLLPKYKNYKVYAKGSDVDISYNIFNLNYGLKRKIENYGTLDGKDVELTINADNNSSKVNVGGKVIEPEQVLENDEVVYYKVTAATNSTVPVLGGGYATEGQFIKVEVRDATGFDGWYIDDKKVSSDPVYIVKVTGDVRVEARYN